MLQMNQENTLKYLLNSSALTCKVEIYIVFVKENISRELYSAKIQEFNPLSVVF